MLDNKFHIEVPVIGEQQISLYNESKQVYELFKDEEDIGFLWLPDGYHPDKIKFFIKACSIHYLSENVEIEPLVEKTTLSKDDKRTKLIQDVIPYVLRYLYWSENLKYEKFKGNGTLEKIGAIEVYVTDNLRVRYSINEWTEISREAERKCVYHKDKNCIYMKNNAGIYDIAVEFSKVFGEIKGLDDFVMNIMSNVSSAEDIMRVKNIDPLPESEERILKKVSKIKEIETVEKAEKEKQLSKSESKEVCSVEDKTETEKITQILVETATQDLSELAGEVVISTDEEDETEEKEWAPEFSSEDVPINVEEYAPEEYEDERGAYSNQNAVFPGQEAGFLKWLFNFRKEAITPLRNTWRGREYDFNNEVWKESKSELRVMNENGITWGISLIESYMNPSFIVTDMDNRTYNFRMREAAKVIWNNLCLRYEEFQIKKSDIPRVAEEIESKISAILRGALNNGYRDFFSTQNQEITTRNLSPQQQRPTQSIWSKTAGFFKRRSNEDI